MLGIFGCSTTKKISNKPCNYYENLYSITDERMQELKNRFNLISIRNCKSYIQDLTPHYPVAEMHNNVSFEDYSDSELLPIQKGQAASRKGLIVDLGNRAILIERKKELQGFYAPIDSKEEAIAYVSIWTDTEPHCGINIPSYYRIFHNEMTDTKAIAHDNGYIVNTYWTKGIGCGPHPYYLIRSFVTTSGEVTELSRLKAFENPEMDRMCID